MPVSNNIKDFVTKFFTASDDTPHSNSSSHDQYLKFYANDATFMFGNNVFKNTDGIKEWRVGAWANVQQREHVVNGIFSDDNQAEAMIHGVVTYTMIGKTEPNPPMQFASRMVFEDPKAQQLKLKYYQVYLVKP